MLQLDFDASIDDQSSNHLATRREAGTGTFGEGHEAQALSCSGSGPYVVVDDAAELRGMEMFTLSVWARKDTAAGAVAIALKRAPALPAQSALSQRIAPRGSSGSVLPTGQAT